MRLGYSAGHVGSNTAARGLSGTKADPNKLNVDQTRLFISQTSSKW